jgi:hypothetical protein
MEFSAIGAWVAFQIAIAESLNASSVIDAACRRHGWQNIAVGVGAGIFDFLFICIGILIFTKHYLGPFADVVSASLVLVVGIYMAQMSWMTFQKQKSYGGSDLYKSRIKSLPVSWSGTLQGFRIVIAPGLAISAVWLGVSLSQGCLTGTFGTVFGFIVVLILATQVSGADLSKQADVPSLYSLSAGVVSAFGIYLLNTAAHHHFA